MKSTIQSINHRNKQRGAVLVISLLLLVVITTLAISGMNTATTELAMARNDQNYEYAFQAAETGLENAMAQGSFDTLVETDLGQNYINTNDEVVAKVRFEDTTLVPDRAFSLGVGSGVAAYHFLATAEAKSKRAPGSTTDRDSSALHTQAFYVVGPESSSL
jgi:type IV pilus assembly protein PilX